MSKDSQSIDDFSQIVSPTHVAQNQQQQSVQPSYYKKLQKKKKLKLKKQQEKELEIFKKLIGNIIIQTHQIGELLKSIYK